MRTLGSFNHPGPMKNRSRSCSAAALAAREHPIRRPAARSRWPPGPGRSSRNGRTIAVRANTRSIAAQASSDASTARLRCDASRSMNAPHRWPSSSFETRARTFVLCGTAAACALLRMRTSTALVVVSHDVKQPISFPRRISAPGVCDFASLTPHRGVGGAPKNVRVLGGTPVGRAMTRHARRLARRLASHDAGRSPLGAPPWRFFTRGRASVSLGARRPTTAGICLPDPCSELLAARS